ncbi:hypothetical protein PY32053_00581 [Paracoccus yeei]|uniref:Uncharacterized protein n=1 Tax=Paracoccus yeei TaxID=147645 RepID=A0A386UIR9_9RHOB|nr:hypothetical protein PY32053_00581 [Paracoccus yeei]
MRRGARAAALRAGAIVTGAACSSALDMSGIITAESPRSIWKQTRKRQGRFTERAEICRGRPCRRCLVAEPV